MNSDNKSAAVQEACDYQYRLIVKATGKAGEWQRVDEELFNQLDGYTNDYYTIERRKLYAAPVAAAPVDTHMLASAVEKALGWREGKRDAELDSLLEQAMAILNGTSAAPGIDHAEMIRSNLRSIRSLASVLPISHVSAANIVDEANHAMDLIVASTKHVCPCGAGDVEKCPGMCAELQGSPKNGSDVPMQPVVTDSKGVLRFKKNTLVRALLDHGDATGFGLNELAQQEHSAEDRMQLAQLIGYSVYGYGTLSYVTDASYDAAMQAAENKAE